MDKLLKRFAYLVIYIVILLLVSHGTVQSQINNLADTPWPMYQHDPQHTGRSPFLAPIQLPELLWTVQLPPCSGSSGGISIAGDGSLLLSIGGCLSKFNPTTRDLRWTYSDQSNSMSVPLISTDGNTVGVKRTGSCKYQHQVLRIGLLNWVQTYIFNSSPTFGVDGNLNFVHDGLWSFTTSGGFNWYIPYGYVGSHASPAIGLDGNIYAGTWIGEGEVCAYLPSGSISWCLDIPGILFDRIVSVGSDGTIYVPTDGNPESPYTDSGVLVAINPSGSLKWKFQPDEINIFYISDGIALAPDGSIYFGLNLLSAESYLYSINSAGQFQWQVPFGENPLTGIGPIFDHPITIDRSGNAIICLENSHCYGIDSLGAVLWDFEFPLTKSIIMESSNQPIIAHDGLISLVDSAQRLSAYADPSQFPILRTSDDRFDFSVDQETKTFTDTITITSTTMSITFTASISPEVAWLSINQPDEITPAFIDLQIDPTILKTGNYHTSIYVDPGDPISPELTIPVNLQVGIHQAYLPLTLVLNQTQRIFYSSNWFVENQFASIDIMAKIGR